MSREIQKGDIVITKSGALGIALSKTPGLLILVGFNNGSHPQIQFTKSLRKASKIQILQWKLTQ
jgi:hypothetical protein